MFLLWRSWLAFTALMVVVLGIMSVLSVLQHNAVLSDLVRQRLSVVVESTASSFNTVVELGMPLSMVRNAGDLLGRAQALDPNIEAIHVFNPSGIVVHSTESGEVPPLSIQELELQRLSSTGSWSQETGTHFSSGVSVFNTEGDIVGGVQAIYPTRKFTETSGQIATRIATAAAGLMAVFSLLVIIILRFRLSPAIRGAQMLQHWLASIRTGKAPEQTSDSLDEAFTELQDQLVAADNAFQAATEQLGNRNEAAVVDCASTAQPAQMVITTLPETALARVFVRRLTPWFIGLILLATLSLGYVTYRSVEESIGPELARRTDLIAHVASTNIQRGVDAGVPLDRMVGMDAFFGELLSNFPEISFFGVATGKMIYRAGSWKRSLLPRNAGGEAVPVYPINDGDDQIGYIIIDPDPDYIALQFQELGLDMAVLVIVVLLLAYEIMIVVISISLTGPLSRLRYLARLQAGEDFSCTVRSRRGSVIEQLNDHLSDRARLLHTRYRALADEVKARGAAIHGGIDIAGIGRHFRLTGSGPKTLGFSYLNDVRLPLFLFAAADELPLSFFPLFTRAAENPITWLDPAVVISLPLAGYLVAYMLASPWSRSLTEKFGHRLVLILALVPVVLSNLGMFFAGSVVEIILLRTVAGAGYAVAVLACQDYVIDVVKKDQRTRSLGIFSAALFAGIFAGTALGGMLADRFGAASVFLFSAILVLLSLGLFYAMIPQGTRDAQGQQPALTMKSIVSPLGDRRFFALVVGIAIPQSIMDQVFISYLFSLQLDSLGITPAAIARMLMAYFLAIMAAGSCLGWLSTYRVSSQVIILVGSAATGAALLQAAFLPGYWGMLLAAVGTGLGHGLVRGPVVDIAMAQAETRLSRYGSSSVMGSLRLFERGGSIVGLLALATITGYFGLLTAIGTIGVLILLGLLLYCLSLSHGTRESDP